MGPRRHDPVSQSRSTPALAFGEPEKSAQALRVTTNGAPTSAAGAPAHDGPVDIGDSDHPRSLRIHSLKTATSAP